MKRKEIIYIDDFGRYGCYVWPSWRSWSKSIWSGPWSARNSRLSIMRLCRKATSGTSGHPTDGSRGDWCRCYVAHPVVLGNLIPERVGLCLRLEVVERRLMPRRDFTLICYNTKWGQHFALGNSEGREVVNPDPELPLPRVDSYRVFKLAT